MSTPPPTPGVPPVTPESRSFQPFLDTPITKTENSSGRSVGDKTAESRYIRLAGEARHTLVGPMPPVEFTNTYFPVEEGDTEDDMPSYEGAFDAVPKGAKREDKALYDPIVEALNAQDARGTSRCPGFEFHFTGNHPESQHGSKADIGCYKVGDKVPKLKNGDNAWSPGHDHLTAEVKLLDIGFYLWEGECKNAEDIHQAKKGFGQIVSYATAICSRQHRSFTFLLFLTPKSARFLRCDRSGIVISDKFDYHAHPEILCRFLWRFSMASDSQRGCDEDVEWASPEEENGFNLAITKHVEDQLGKSTKEEINRHYEPCRVVKVPVRTHPSSNQFRYFLISRPVAYPMSLAGRATRGYWAVEVGTSKVVFLKDTWRPRIRGMEQEGTTLKELNKKNIPNVPSLVCHGDVEKNSCTQTDLFKEKEWNKAYIKGESRLTSRVHYRQVVGEAGYALEQLAGTHELLRGVHCVYIAICQAFSVCKLLHRDISSGNIILFADTANPYGRRRALLTDWETACPIQRSGDARDHWRSGTWAFMSIRVLNGDSYHSIADDVESLIHIVFYCGLLYLQWNCTEQRFLNIIEGYFNQHVETDPGKIVGGGGKQANLFSGCYYKIALFECQPLLDWITRSGDYLRPFYQNFHTSTYKAPKPKDVKDGFEDLFLPDYAAFLAGLPKDDRKLNPWPYKGLNESIFHATMVSFSNHPMKSDNGVGVGDAEHGDANDEERPSRQRVKLSSISSPDYPMETDNVDDVEYTGIASGEDDDEDGDFNVNDADADEHDYLSSNSNGKRKRGHSS